jgi:thiamine biosynthesis lipoprotein
MLATLAGCARAPEPVKLAGATMGTTWHVTYVPGEQPVDPAGVQRAVQAQLDAVNASMSTYRTDSEISRINAGPVGASVALSDGFLNVLRVALDVGQRSGGAYDVTVGPLVNLWGFGPGEQVTEPPAPRAVKQALQRVGQQHLALQGNALTRQVDAYLDFSSLAKGYAVDRVAQALAGMGLRDFLVEVGGEMRLSGSSPRGTPWRIAIERPEAGGRMVDTGLDLTDIAIATSGDYRNFFEVDGRRYSHTIDPRDGYPVAHGLVSVTVLHEQAVYADAWATALSVLGQQAEAVAEEQGLAVYLIFRVEGELVHSHTRAFAPYLAQTEEGG